MLLAGRGAGKTRTGAETTRSFVKAGYKRIGLIAPTAADGRDVMVEGESGILAHAWRHDVDYQGNLVGIPDYEPSKRRLTWKNGAVGTIYSAEEPDRLRGPQHDFLWADELAAWQYPGDTWDMAMFGLRLGKDPKALISTTPRPIPIIRELVRDPMTRISRASTFANEANLAKNFLHKIVNKYKGTRLGKQELEGLVIEEAEGALWSRETIDAAHDGQLADFVRIVVAIDPAVSANPTSNLTGIVVAALGRDRRGYVLEDLSGRYTPDEWARTAVDAYDRYGADRIVAEGNQGGDLVRVNVSTVRKNLPISIVWASRSKQARAEPVAALYEQHKITHCTIDDLKVNGFAVRHSWAGFAELEDQMCTWEPLSGDPSPDRLDALVWAFTELMLGFEQDVPFVNPIIVSQSRNFPGS